MDIRNFFRPNTQPDGTDKVKKRGMSNDARDTRVGDHGVDGAMAPCEPPLDWLERKLGKSGVRNCYRQLGFLDEALKAPVKYLLWTQNCGIPEKLSTRGGRTVYPHRRILQFPALQWRRKEKERRSVQSELKMATDEKVEVPGGNYYKQHALVESACRADPLVLLRALRGGHKDSRYVVSALRCLLNVLAIRNGWWVQGDAKHVLAFLRVVLGEVEEPHEYTTLERVLESGTARDWKVRAADVERHLPDLGLHVIAYYRPFATYIVKKRVYDTSLSILESIDRIAEVGPDPGPGFGDGDAARQLLTDEQFRVFLLVQEHRAVLLRGAGGTGKTHTLKAIAKYAGFAHVFHFSPTHRVRQNAEGSFDPADIEKPEDETPARIVCRTVHWATYHGTMKGGARCTLLEKLLDEVPKGSVLVVIDEGSMVSTVQYATLLRVVRDRPNVHVLVAGDPRQLEPVKSRGLPFVDLIAGRKFPSHVHLTKDHRAGGRFATFFDGMHAHRSTAPRFADLLATAGAAVNFVCTKKAGHVEVVLDLVRKHRSGGGIMWHERRIENRSRPTLMIVATTNILCQNLAGPVRTAIEGGKPKKKKPSSLLHREGRREPVGWLRCDQIVVMTENTESYKNGDLARVLVEPGGCVYTGDGNKQTLSQDMSCVALLKLEDPGPLASRGKRRVVKDELAGIHVVFVSELKPADVITVHGSQGAEADEVIVVLPPHTATRMIDRRLVYTAESRAKKTIHLVGGKCNFDNARLGGLSREYRTVLRIEEAIARAARGPANITAFLTCAARVDPWSATPRQRTLAVLSLVATTCGRHVAEFLRTTP